MSRNALSRWTWLLAGVALIWLFMFHMGPALRDSVPAFRDYAANVDQLGFNAGAVYYTDVDVVPRANLSTRSTFDYTPTGPVGHVAR